MKLSKEHSVWANKFHRQLLQEIYLTLTTDIHVYVYFV